MFFLQPVEQFDALRQDLVALQIVCENVGRRLFVSHSWGEGAGVPCQVMSLKWQDDMVLLGVKTVHDLLFHSLHGVVEFFLGCIGPNLVGAHFIRNILCLRELALVLVSHVGQPHI